MEGITGSQWSIENVKQCCEIRKRARVRVRVRVRMRVRARDTVQVGEAWTI